MSVHPSVRAAVIRRAESCCERCGRWCNTAQGEYSLQHRRSRSMGGSRRPETDGPTNLALLCGHATQPGHCHHFVESHPMIAMLDGWRVPQHGHPASVPILHHELGRVWLTESYEYTETAPA